MAKFRLEYNVGGISGLHIAYNVITEDTERRFFFDEKLYQRDLSGKTRKDFWQGKDKEGILVPQCWQLFNIARDIGLARHMMLCDFAANQTYSSAQYYGQRGLRYHFDDPVGFGEYILGASFGIASELRMLYDPPDLTKPWKPSKDEEESSKDPSIFNKQEALYDSYPRAPGMEGSGPVCLILPRRSMYILSGDARSKWKHSVYSTGRIPAKQVEAAVLGLEYVHPVPMTGELLPQHDLGPLEEAPAWNPERIRRSLTLRSAKSLEIVCLERALAGCYPDEKDKIAFLEARIAQQVEERERVPKTFFETSPHFDGTSITHERDMNRQEHAAYWWERLNKVEKSQKCEERLPVEEIPPSVLEAMTPVARKLYGPFQNNQEKRAYLDMNGTFNGLFGGFAEATTSDGAGKAAGGSIPLDLNTPAKKERNAGASGSNPAAQTFDLIGSQEAIEHQFLQQALVESLAGTSTHHDEQKDFEKAVEASLQMDAAEAARVQEEEELKKAMAASLAEVYGRKRRREEEGGGDDDQEEEVIDLTLEDD